MIHILNKTNSVLNTFIAEIRDEQIQKDGMRFRKNLERIGGVMAYEISKTLHYKSAEVKTQLGIAKVNLPEEQPVIASILRAGLTLHQGVLNYFDLASNAFISAYRKYHETGDGFDVHVEYSACPDLSDKILILCDPLLATGSSMVLTYKALLKHGKPAHTHIACVIASVAGVDYVKKHLPDVTLWCCAVDDELTSHSYIVPGLGDAGDLAYGKKL